MPFERLIDDIMNARPCISSVASPSRPPGLPSSELPGVFHAEADDALGISVVHVAPSLAEAAHVAEAVHAQTDVPLRQGKPGGFHR